MGGRSSVVDEVVGCDQWSWVVRRASWVVGRGSWVVVGRGSWLWSWSWVVVCGHGRGRLVPSLVPLQPRVPSLVLSQDQSLVPSLVSSQPQVNPAAWRPNLSDLNNALLQSICCREVTRGTEGTVESLSLLSGISAIIALHARMGGARLRLTFSHSVAARTALLRRVGRRGAQTLASISARGGGGALLGLTFSHVVAARTSAARAGGVAPTLLPSLCRRRRRWAVRGSNLYALAQRRGSHGCSGLTRFGGVELCRHRPPHTSDLTRV